jgi:hypothetical protein
MNDGLENTFIALVTFENSGDVLEILPAECNGACGWMAVKAETDTQVLDALRKELSQIELKLVEVDRVTQVYSTDEIAEYDDHLAVNVAEWEPGKATVWGTIHTYLAEGEA